MTGERRDAWLPPAVTVALLSAGVFMSPGCEAQARPATDSVESFVDALMLREMERLDVPGAVVVLVEGSATVMAKGYGLADRDGPTAVDVDETAFRVASVGKLFTALAVLSLESDGQLDLERDVNEYLRGFELPADGWPPSTLHQLLVHTGGFDERLIGYLAREASDFPALGDYLARRMPRRGHTPGEIQSYSNHGFALAGYVAECVAGEPLHRLVERRVLTPLDMSSSGFAVPPLPPWLDALATEYWASGDVAEVAFSKPYPAGAFATTGRDMERFFRGLGRAARGLDQEPFTERVLDGLFRVRFRQHPLAPGETYGFAEHFIEGTRVLVRGGAAPAHSALVAVLPASESGRPYVGLFVALNRQEPQLWEALLKDLVRQRYAEPQRARPDAEIDLDRYAGTYLWTRNARHSLERILELATQVEVTVDGERLRLSGLVPGAEGGYRPVGDDLFLADSGEYLAFRESGGRIEYHFRAIDGEHFAFRRIGRLCTTATQLSLLAASLLIALSWLLTRAIGTLVRRWRRGGRPATGSGPSLLWLHLTAAAELVTAAGLLAVLADWRALVYGPTGLLLGVLATAIVAAVGTAVSTIVALRAWTRHRWSLGTRVHLTLVTLSAWIFTAQLGYYNLIGFQY